MKCLVTGVAGFIGSHIAERLLHDGHEVIGVDAFTDAYAPSLKEANVSGLMARDQFRMIRGDLLRLGLEEILEGVDVVFHQAAQAGVRSSWGGEFHLYLERNVQGTQRLLEACKERSLKKFIYASSSSVYGDAEAFPSREDALPCPVSPYGVTKLAAEHLCVLYWRNYGVPTVCLRYFTVCGPRQRPDMAFHRFLSALWRDEPLLVYGDGNQSRDFTYVSDIVDANMRAAESAPPGGVFNIGGGAHATLLDVLQIMQEIAGREPRIRWEKVQRGDVKHTWADLSLARQAFGYAPQVPLKEGIAREYAWLVGILERSSGD